MRVMKEKLLPKEVFKGFKGSIVQYPLVGTIEGTSTVHK